MGAAFSFPRWADSWCLVGMHPAGIDDDGLLLSLHGQSDSFCPSPQMSFVGWEGSTRQELYCLPDDMQNPAESSFLYGSASVGQKNGAW